MFKPNLQVTYKTVNPEDREYFDRLFAVSLAGETPMLVYAESMGSALDHYADYAQDEGWHGLFLSQDDIEDCHLEDIVYVGNCSWPVYVGYLYTSEITE